MTNFIDQLKNKIEFSQKVGKLLFAARKNVIVNPVEPQVGVVDITENPEGGYFMQMEGEALPMRSMPLTEEVKMAALTKGMIPLAIDQAYKMIFPYIRETNKYSPFVQEFHHVLTIMVDRERYKEQKEAMGKLRDVVCFILESDMAYRYRLQDVIPEFDMSKVKLNENDIYYTNKYVDYNFRDIEPPERLKENIEKYPDSPGAKRNLAY